MIFSILLQHHTSKVSKYFWSNFGSVKVQPPYKVSFKCGTLPVSSLTFKCVCVFFITEIFPVSPSSTMGWTASPCDVVYHSMKIICVTLHFLLDVIYKNVHYPFRFELLSIVLKIRVRYWCVFVSARHATLCRLVFVRCVVFSDSLLHSAFRFTLGTRTVKREHTPFRKSRIIHILRHNVQCCHLSRSFYFVRCVTKLCRGLLGFV